MNGLRNKTKKKETCDKFDHAMNYQSPQISQTKTQVQFQIG